ncbi:MAG: MFS transporter [Bradyrhizobium sp.]
MSDTTVMTYTKNERRLVAWSAIFGFGLDFYNLIIFSFLFGAVLSSLHITLPQAGIVVSMTLASSVVGGILIGWLGDKIGRKNALLGTLLLLAAGAILSALAWDFTSLLIFRIIAGIGVGGEWGAGIVLLNEVWENRRRGVGSGIVQASAAGGVALASVVAAYSLSHYSPDTAWRISVAVGGLPLVLVVFIRSKMPESQLWAEYRRMKKLGKLPAEKIAEKTPIIEIFKGASLRYFIIGTLAMGGYAVSYLSITIFMPLLMSKGLGATPDVIRNLSLAWAVALATGMIVSGYISDAHGRKRSCVLATLLCIVGLVGIYVTGGTKFEGNFLSWSLFWWYFIWGLAQGSVGQFGAWFSELFPVELRSTGTSTTYTTGRLIGSSAPYLVPAIAASFGSLLDAMMISMVGAAVSLIAVLLLPETAGRRFAVVESKERTT